MLRLGRDQPVVGIGTELTEVYVFYNSDSLARTSLEQNICSLGNRCINAATRSHNGVGAKLEICNHMRCARNDGLVNPELISTCTASHDAASTATKQQVISITS